MPYTGYYKIGVWAAAGGTNGRFGVKNISTNETNEIDISPNQGYKLYELEIWGDKDDIIETYVIGGNAWVNGDDFSLEYNKRRFSNMVVNPDFTSSEGWDKKGKASISEGQAVLEEQGDAISQEIYIPEDGPYYIEAELKNAENATISFAGIDSEAVTGTKTVRISIDEITGHEARTLQVSGRTEVTPVDEFGLSGDCGTSGAKGAIVLKLVQNPGFEQGRNGWNNQLPDWMNKYEGTWCAKIMAGKEMSQNISVKKAGYYNLSAYTKYAGNSSGQIVLTDETGKEIANIPVMNSSEYTRVEQKKIPLESGQKVTLYLRGASDKEYYIDNVYLDRDTALGYPPFKNIMNFETWLKAVDTDIDRENKEVSLKYMYEVELSKIQVKNIIVSEEAVASVEEGDILNLTKPEKITVTGNDGSKETWTLNAENMEKKVALKSSNEYLEDTFNWAAHKMDQFMMTGKHGLVNKDENRPNGTGEADYEPSYWAGYYDRSAYYSRDFVHQATGGQIAGLEEENYNMFETFAENCTEARKYYTLWCFNFDGTPHTIDYSSDDRFVREVPAQFELVEKAYKQYLWSGDERYISDEMFEFYTNVMTKYVELHDTNGNGVAEGTGKGIFDGSASYNERGGEPLLEAGDSIGSQYQATLAYAGILKARGDDQGAEEWYQKAADLKKYFNENWSVVEGQEDTYARGLSTDGVTKYTGFGKENSWFMPMKMITEPGARNDAYIEFVLENLGEGIGSSGAPTNLEAYTYIPDMLFPYNRSDDAWKWMKYITSIKDEPHERPSQGTNGDYPEISFTFVSQVIEGMMGVEPNAGENLVATSPRLPGEVPDVTAKYMDIGDYELDLTHTGNNASDLTNHSDKPITWEARFYGEHNFIKIGDKTVKAETKDINGETVSYAVTTVGAGETVHAETAEDDGTQPGTVNKDELRKLYDSVKDLEKGNYTDDSWQTFESAREYAGEILLKEDVVQSEVDSAYNDLNTAYQNLSEKTDAGNGSGEDNNSQDI